MFVKPRHDRGECTLKKMTFRCFTYWPNKRCNHLELLMEIEHFLLKCWHNVLLFSMIFFCTCDFRLGASLVYPQGSSVFYRVTMCPSQPRRRARLSATSFSSCGRWSARLQTRPRP